MPVTRSDGVLRLKHVALAAALALAAGVATGGAARWFGYRRRLAGLAGAEPDRVGGVWQPADRVVRIEERALEEGGAGARPVLRRSCGANGCT